MATQEAEFEQSVGWIQCRLSDVCSAINYGLTASATDDPAGLRFLRITDIVSGDLDWERVPFVTADGSTEEKYKLHDADIVIARTGASTGASAYIKDPPPSVFASYLVRLKTKPEFDARFVAYYLKSEEFWSYIRGVLGDKSAQPNASASTMASAPFRSPKQLSEQRAIAHVLGTLDDKIELNRRMNRTLEEMARAIFRDWFVDFGPTRAKMERQEPYLPPELWDLFPDELVDSEMGEIPEGWETTDLGTVATFPVRTVRPQELSSETAYIGLEHMPRKSVALYDWDSPEKVTSNKLSFQKGEFLFGKLRPYFHKVGLAPTDGICSTDIVVVAPKTKSWSSFVLLSISTDEFVAYTDQTSNGTKMPRTSWKTMGQYRICLPMEPVAEAFQATTQLMLERIVSNIHEAYVLEAQRETLLPQLIRGDVKVAENDGLGSYR